MEEERMRDELAEILSRRLDALEREHADVLDLLDELHQREEKPEPGAIEDKARWLRGARKEMNALIREIEGATPVKTRFPLLEMLVDAEHPYRREGD